MVIAAERRGAQEAIGIDFSPPSRGGACGPHQPPRVVTKAHGIAWPRLHFRNVNLPQTVLPLRHSRRTLHIWQLKPHR
jgi:hypothetical protein